MSVALCNVCEKDAACRIEYARGRASSAGDYCSHHGADLMGALLPLTNKEISWFRYELLRERGH